MTSFDVPLETATLVPAIYENSKYDSIESRLADFNSPLRVITQQLSGLNTIEIVESVLDAAGIKDKYTVFELAYFKRLTLNYAQIKKHSAEIQKLAKHKLITELRFECSVENGGGLYFDATEITPHKFSIRNIEELEQARVAHTRLTPEQYDQNLIGIFEVLLPLENIVGTTKHMTKIKKVMNKFELPLR